MEQLTNLDKLTEKIYQEGLSKADQQSKEILQKAEKKAEQIVNEASTRAEELVNNAKKAIERETKSAESEIKLKGKQLISDLKNEINHLLREKILVPNIRDSFSDQTFLKSLILEIAGYWKAEGELELSLPAKLKEKLDGAIEKDLSDHVNNLTVTFSDKVSDGFRIARKADSYVITFNEEDFIELFSSYLKERTRTMLFAEKP